LGSKKRGKKKKKKERARNDVEARKGGKGKNGGDQGNLDRDHSEPKKKEIRIKTLCRKKRKKKPASVIRIGPEEGGGKNSRPERKGREGALAVQNIHGMYWWSKAEKKKEKGRKGLPHAFDGREIYRVGKGKGGPRLCTAVKRGKGPQVGPPTCFAGEKGERKA